MGILLDLDLELFYTINGWNSPLWDNVMAFVSRKDVWIPVYAAIAYFLKRQMDWKTWGLCLLSVGLMVAITDQTTSSLLKPNVERYRPCRVEAQLDQPVHIVNNKCGGKYGFASSHAANFWGLATFLSFVFRKKWFSRISLFVAATVGYSRVYLGVHYPGDVIVGAIIGALAGWTVYRFFMFLDKKWQLKRGSNL